MDEEIIPVESLSLMKGIDNGWIGFSLTLDSSAYGSSTFWVSPGTYKLQIETNKGAFLPLIKLTESRSYLIEINREDIIQF